MFAAWVLAAVLAYPPDVIERADKTYEFDLIELNHVRYDEPSMCGFDQYIFWRWHHGLGHYVPEHYVITRGLNLPDCTSGVYSIRTYGNGAVLKFTARHFRETTTAYDPEQEMRGVWPLSSRRLRR